MSITHRYNSGPRRGRAGFTLIEMIISIAIFMIVAVVAVGSLVRIVGLNRLAQNMQSAVNNVGFVLDSMSREIRQASTLACLSDYNGETITLANISGACADMSSITTDITNKKRLVVFMSAKTATDGTGNRCNLYYAYWFTKLSGSSYYTVKKAQETSCSQPVSDGNFFSVIDDSNVKILSYNLAEFATYAHKWMFIHIIGLTGTRLQDQNTFNVQTSISQRIGG